MTKLNLAAKGNTLKTALAEFCKKEWYVAKQAYLLDGEISDLEELIVRMDKANGTVVAFTEEQKADTKAALEVAKKERAELRKREEGKYEWTDADRRLKKAWKANPDETQSRMSIRTNAIEEWLRAYGLDCECGQAMDIAKKVGGFDIKAVSLKKVALDGANYTEDKLTLNIKLLYKYMIDLHADAGCWSPNLIPEDLRDAWKADRDAAEARRKAKKEAKKANK